MVQPITQGSSGMKRRGARSGEGRGASAEAAGQGDVLNVGGKHVRVADDDGYLFPMLVMYPTSTAAAPIALGPFNLDMAANAPPRLDTYPIVVISHGSGGTHLGYLELARRLVRAGYVVLMPEHPGNSRSNNQLADSPLNLANRPRHLTLAINQIRDDDLLGRTVEDDRVAVVGHSMGGYTALAIAGGRPSTNDGRSVAVAADPRVKALVLLAPATPWFMKPGALARVRVPILMLTGEHDPHTPPFHAEVVKAGLPRDTPIDHRVVGNAGHFSFMSPFPEMMRSPDFLPGNDPEGFDRAAYQETLASDVVEFLDTTLA
jgi:predicted dienelactone hydrolase